MPLEMTHERRNELALIGLMEIVGKLPAKEINFTRMVSRLNRYLGNLPKAGLLLFEDSIHINAWANEIVHRHSGVGEPMLTEDEFRRVAYPLLVAYYWSEDLPLGFNLRRRIYSNQREDISNREVYQLVDGVIETFREWLRPRKKS